MIKFKFIAALACLALAACQPSEPVNNNSSSGPVATVPSPASCGLAAGTLVDERTLYGAETAYNVPAHAYVTADATGKLPADLKARVRPLLVESYRLLQLARSAYKLGDVCGLNNYAAGARNFAERAKAILPR